MKALAGLMLLVAGWAGAQIPCGLGMAAPILMSWSKLPMQMTVKTSFEQQLLDGNLIRRESITHEAVNKAGWTRRELAMICFVNEAGQPETQMQVSVYKRDLRETLSWEESSVARKVARLSRTPLIPVMKKDEVEAAPVRMPKQPWAELTTEQLGGSTIAGVAVTGVRHVRILPVGMEGNSLPLRVVTEKWTSKDQIVMRSMIDDPRRGKTVSEVQEVVMGEPDAKEFAPPEGYVVREMGRAGGQP